jgi:FtsP/CotA-like multicopper oxidase with cupredoxin domain
VSVVRIDNLAHDRQAEAGALGLGREERAENSFEVVGMPGNPAYRRLHDTVWLDPFSKLVIRMRFKTFKGKSVFHCHILPHEDTAMMQYFMIA